MEAPEYLDLDEIDFSDDISYSVTSLKTIPELCRRCDSQNEDRSGHVTCSHFHNRRCYRFLLWLRRRPISSSDAFRLTQSKHPMLKCLALAGIVVSQLLLQTRRSPQESPMCIVSSAQ
uniref:Synuclein alpha interacting protein n=1 Tax=Ovis aries TaxID=9940 RepID=A0AC11EQQ4_SHEEP